MSYELSQEFTFEAAHTLARTVPLTEYAPSIRIHGHSYTATVTVIGEKGESGMIERFAPKKNKREKIDLFYLRAEIAKVRKTLDHRFLDELEPLGPATLENLCLYICEAIKKTMPVHAVTVRRVTGGDSCTYRP